MVKTGNKCCITIDDYFDLEQTLNCGQAFRFIPQSDGSFDGVVMDRVCNVSFEDNRLIIFSNADEDFWRFYFDIDTDYGAIQKQFRVIPNLDKACRYAGGIRVLRQNGWEALASFIISQNNNIKRISGIIERLCENFGQPIEGCDRFSFPEPEEIAKLTIEDLAPLRCGFRARYLIDAANKVVNGDVDLEKLKTCPVEQARESLKSIVGVGNKVADCTLLFGCHRIECLPVDVWIARALKELFPSGIPQEILPVAGIAQQMLFHYMRTGRSKD